MKKLVAIIVLSLCLITPSQATDSTNQKYYVDVVFCFTDKKVEIYPPAGPAGQNISNKKVTKNSWMYPVLQDSHCMINKGFKRFEGIDGYKKYAKWFKSNVGGYKKPQLAIQMERNIVFAESNCRYPYYSVYQCEEVFYDEKGSYVKNPSKKFRVIYEIKPNISLDNVDDYVLDKLLEAAKNFREKKITEAEFDQIKDEILKML